MVWKPVDHGTDQQFSKWTLFFKCNISETPINKSKPLLERVCQNLDSWNRPWNIFKNSNSSTQHSLNATGKERGKEVAMKLFNLLTQILWLETSRLQLCCHVWETYYTVNCRQEKIKQPSVYMASTFRGQLSSFQIYLDNIRFIYTFNKYLLYYY